MRHDPCCLSSALPPAAALRAVRASQSGDWRTVALIISDNKCDINARDAAGYSALHYSCSAGRQSIAQMLVDNGADVNRARPNVVTPLWVACEKGHPRSAPLPRPRRQG